MNMAFAYHGMQISLKVEVRDPCPVHVDPNANYWKIKIVRKGWRLAVKKVYQLPECACEKPLRNTFTDEFDLGTKQFLNFVISDIFDTNTATNALKDTGGATHTGSANTATGTINLHMGAGTTTAVVADYQIEVGSYDWSTVAATVNTTVTDNTTNCTSTITGLFTNSTGVNKTAGNVGIEITSATFVYLVAHDNINGGTGYVVSPAGTVAVTYTITVS